MDDTTAHAALECLQRWQSAAGGDTVLRGRRSAQREPMLHFLHGNGFCGGVYWPFLRALLPHYGLFWQDLEGHGDSERAARYSGTPAIIERVPKIIAEQLAGTTRLIGIGHSFGAAVTLAVAARNPGLFRALVLLDPIVLPTRAWLGVRMLSALGRNPMAEAARRRRDRWASRDEALERLRGRGIYRGWRDDAFECFIDFATRDDIDGRVLSCPREIEAAIFEQPVYPWRHFARIDCPVLFLHGTHSYPFFGAAVRKLRRINPRVEIAALPGGHCFMQEAPETAAASVLAFLAGHGF